MKNITKRNFNARYDAALPRGGPAPIMVPAPPDYYDKISIDDEVEDHAPMCERNEFPTADQVRAVCVARAALDKFEWLLNPNGESK